MKHFLVRVFLFSLIFSLNQCKTARTELGSKAYDWTRELVDIGPRSSSSPGIQKARDWIGQKVKEQGLTLQQRPFVAKTPIGFLNMVNLSFVIPGTKHDRQVILLAHYDSKLFSKGNFVGANDAASSVALLLSLSGQIQKLQLPFDVQIMFVDGEEAIVEWNFNDSLYGSRQVAQDLHGKLTPTAVIVVDMIGDKDLTYIRTRGVDKKLLSYFEQSLQEMNQSAKLDQNWSYVMDDHTPFVEAGIPTLHVMDFTYGSGTSPGALWHTEQDTMNNISAESLSITGEAILRILKKIP